MNAPLRGWRVTACVLICIAGIGQSSHGTDDPVLYFSDIASGPRTGNTDVSLGQISGQDGAIVTIWGRNFGAPGTATVTCNGATAAYYYAQENATRPANLTTYHRMEMISFQIRNTAQDGFGSITVVVNGKQSNTLPFTVRPGNIYYVKSTGSDVTGNGTWANPWQTIAAAKDSIVPGDIVYVCNGVHQVTETEYGACVNLGTHGEPGKPKALVVYPGATAMVGNDSLYYAFQSFYADTGGSSRHWVVAKFTVRTAGVSVPAQTGYRVIGNLMTAPNGDGADAAITVEGDSVVVAGNELDNVGRPDCDKLYHGIYGKGFRTDVPPRAPTESEREIAWNYIHDCQSDRAIDLYSEQPFSAFIQRHRIHDNVIINQHGDGILIGYYVVGENWIYNNLIVRAGLGPEWAGGEASSHAGIRIDCGHETGPATTIYCYNNTLVACGWPGAVWHEESGHLYVSPLALSRATTVDFRNNIILSGGEPYAAEASGTMPSGNHNNCWYGAGSAPPWDLNAINAPPVFADTNTSDFRLAPGSPCINTGQDVSTVVGRDLLGTPRPQGPSFDLGVYESESAVAVGMSGNDTEAYLLTPCYPNPFNPSTTISFALPQRTRVQLSIVDAIGRLVRTLLDDNRSAGTHTVVWDGSNSQGVPAAAGVYFCRMRTGSWQATEQLLLIH